MPHDLSSVTPVAEMAGEDAEETGLLRAALGDARGYLPVKARPTPGNADDLEKRLALLRDDVIPSLSRR